MSQLQKVVQSLPATELVGMGFGGTKAAKAAAVAAAAMAPALLTRHVVEGPRVLA